MPTQTGLNPFRQALREGHQTRDNEARASREVEGEVESPTPTSGANSVLRRVREVQAERALPEVNTPAQPPPITDYNSISAVLERGRRPGRDFAHNTPAQTAASPLTNYTGTRLNDVESVRDFCQTYRIPARLVGTWIWVAFPNRPSRVIITAMKRAGFRWVDRRGEWAHRCGSARARFNTRIRHPEDVYPTSVISRGADNEV